VRSNANACNLPNTVFFSFSSNVTHVPGSNLLGIFVSDWQCKFWWRFWLVTEEKTKFGFKVLVSLWYTKTFVVLVYLKGFYQNFFIYLFCAMLLGLSTSQINITI
jgi:hypothetical protein